MSVLHSLAYASLNHTNYAAQSHKNTLSIDANDCTSHYNLAVIFQRKGDLDSALKYTDRAVAVCNNTAKETPMQLLNF